MLNECWEWNGSRDGCGYGMKVIQNTSHKTHRLAWAWANWDGEGDWKDVPEGMCVCHHCDNPPCVNPDHLFLGTHADNTRDKMEKGGHRWSDADGENNNCAKLTIEQVREIRASSGWGSQASLAREFGVTHQTVSSVKRGKNWGRIS